MFVLGDKTRGIKRLLSSAQINTEKEKKKGMTRSMIDGDFG